jgi:hypothetical protein
MAGSSWTPSISHIQDGEPVSGGVASRPDRALEQRTGYLRDRLNAAAVGQGVVAPGVPLDPAVLAGQPVAWVAEDNRFAQAIAQVTTDGETGALVLSPLSDCIGIVVRKNTPGTAGDLLLAGRHAVDLTDAGVTAAGRYYLSPAEPGKLVAQRPPMSVPVLYYDGTYAYVLPNFKDFFEGHVHHKVELACKPAGTHSDPGSPNPHVITSPNASLQGWLPANHATFAGKAPTGAAFGYNIAAHPALERVWPPIPPSSATLILDKGAGASGAVIPLGLNGLCHVNQDGIWWMSNCYGDVPWPTAYNSASPPTPVPPNSASPECPRDQEMRLSLWFVELLLQTDKSVVTSLTAAEDGPITILNCDGDPASTGDLVIGLDLDFLVDDGDDEEGHLFFKTLDGITFKRGPGVEWLEQGSNVTLTPTVGTAEEAQGRVRIDVDVDLAERELPPQTVVLDDAEERDHLGVPFLGFPSGRSSSVRLRFSVPPIGLPASPTVKVRILVYGSTTGTLPATVMSYRRLPRPSGGAGVALPASDTSVTCNTNAAITAGQYKEFESAAITVAAGDTLLVSFTRNKVDGYSGEVGLIRIGAVLVAGS